MDLVYIPEVFTYGSFRSPQYRDYEQPWNRDYFNYGKSTSSMQQQRTNQQQQQYHTPQQRSVSKDSCHLCRESKRRSLAAYIRGKSRRSSCQEIHEEEEENETVCDDRDKAAVAECPNKGLNGEDETVSGQK